MNAFRKLVLTLQGSFDTHSARRVEEALECVQPGGELHVDLTRVVEFQDLAIAKLANVVGKTDGAVRIVLSGLGLHQLRVLAYLGVDPGALARRPCSLR